MCTRSLFNACYSVIDDMILNPDANLPALNRQYQAAFAALASDLRADPVEMAECPHCREVKPLAEMDTIASDYTADRAAYDWSYERDEEFCTACRNEFIDEYGTEKSQSYRHWSYDA